MWTKKVWLLILSCLLIFTACNPVNLHMDLLDENEDQIQTTEVIEDNKEVTIELGDSLDGGLLQAAIHTESFLAAHLLDEAILKAKKVDDYDDYHVTGAILPHHDVSYLMMANLYANIASEDVDLIIVIGPNHFGSNDGILTYKGDFMTSIGTVQVANEAVDTLINSGVCRLDNDQIFATEHSLNIQMGFISHYFQDAKILPILIGEEHRQDVVEQMEQVLGGIIEAYEGRVLVLGTVDFAHYLDAETTQLHDEITMNLIDKMETDILLTLDDGFIDAPTVLTLVMRLLENDHRALLDHSNAKNILGTVSSEGMTSYMTYVFFEDQ